MFLNIQHSVSLILLADLTEMKAKKASGTAWTAILSTVFFFFFVTSCDDLH